MQPAATSRFHCPKGVVFVMFQKTVNLHPTEQLQKWSSVDCVVYNRVVGGRGGVGGREEKGRADFVNAINRSGTDCP